MDRRAFLVAGGAVGAGLAAWRLLPRLTPSAERRVFSADADVASDEAFPLSVASADPTPHGALVWTRVAPARHASGEPLGLEVARDAEMREVAHRTLLPASLFGADTDHTVRVDLDGALEPDRTYHYRFVHQGARSRIGRLRTLPEPDARPERARIAFASCQMYQSGHYGGFARLAEEDADLLVHLGDAIYEYGGGGVDGRSIELPSGAARASSLEDFRHLHRTYRADPESQRALERCTLIAGWDDHEVANNRYWDYEEDRPRCPGHPADDDGARMTRIYADAVRAWTEYVPARVLHDRGGAHLHRSFRMYRSFRFGALAELVVTDERLYRSRQPCADVPAAARVECVEEPGQTMLGEEQKRWFLDTMTTTPAQWKLWANAVMLQPIRRHDRGNLTGWFDSWHGYEAERRELLGALAAARVRDLVAVTGDAHATLAGHLQLEHAPLALAPEPLGVEFVVPALSSGADGGMLADPAPDADDATSDAIMRAGNPHVAFFNGRANGYAVLDLAPEGAELRFVAVDRLARPKEAKAATLARFRVPAGRPALERLE